jgi:spermidine synthase
MDKSLRKTEVLLFISVFTIATCGLVYELIAGALASYLLGDSVRQFSFIIGIYLSAMGVGAWLAKFIQHRLLERFIEIELLVGLVGGFSAALLFAVFRSAGYFEFLLYGLVFLTGVLVGTELPLLMNILQHQVAFKDLVSNVFTFDYIGALLASLLFPLVLVPYLGLIQTGLLFGIFNVLIALLLCYRLETHITGLRLLRFKAWGALILLSVGMSCSNFLLEWSEGQLYAEQIIYTQSSEYQRLVLTRTRQEMRLYINNNLQFSSRDEHRYHEALVHPVLTKAPSVRNVLILGGGDGLAAREALKYPDVHQVTLVDIDPAMTRLFTENPLLTRLNRNALRDPRLQVVNSDAFVWLRTVNQQQFDAVIVDFPDPSNYSLGKLYTTTFYEALAGAMTDSALVTIQSTSPYFAPTSFWCIAHTLGEVFHTVYPYHVMVPSFGEWGFLLAGKHDFDVHRSRRSPAQLRFYDHHMAPWLYFDQDMIERPTEVNRLDNQILVRYFTEEWAKEM